MKTVAARASGCGSDNAERIKTVMREGHFKRANSTVVQLLASFLLLNPLCFPVSFLFHPNKSLFVFGREFFA